MVYFFLHCCLFHYLEAMEVGPGFAVSCHHCREVRSYFYFHFKPVLYIWKELLYCNDLRAFIPFFCHFLFCLHFYFPYQCPFRDLVVGDRSIPVWCSCFCYWSASSFPCVPICALTHENSIVHLAVSRMDSFFQIYSMRKLWSLMFLRTVFLNRQGAARYRAQESIIPGHETFSWNLSFWFSKHFLWINIL